MGLRWQRSGRRGCIDVSDEYDRQFGLAMDKYIPPEKQILQRRKGYRKLSPEEVEALPDDVKDRLKIPRQAPDKE